MKVPIRRGYWTGSGRSKEKNYKEISYMEIKRRDFIKMTGGAALMASMPVLYGFSGISRQDFKDEDFSQIMKLVNREEYEILSLAALAPSGHNTQPWKISVIEPGKWILGSAKLRWLPGVDPNNRELLLSIGAFLRNLEIAAGIKGLSVDTDVLSIDPKDTSIAEIEIRKGKTTAFMLEKLRMRRTVRSGMLTQPVSSSDVSFITSSSSDDFMFFPKGSKEADYLEQSTIEANRTQASRNAAWVELSNWIRWSNSDAKKFRNGLTPLSMGITGFLGWYVRTFYSSKTVLTDGFKKRSIEMVQNQVSNYGGWLVLTSPLSDISSLISTGSKLQDMLLKTREKMIAVHPMTQVLEEQPFRDTISKDLGIGKRVQFVLRIGYLKDYPDPVSLRMPVSWFVSA
jgi:hypothetical protein